MEFVLLVLAIAVVFVLMVRRARRREADLFRTLDEQQSRPWDGPKPKPLSRTQRKALKLKPLQTGKPVEASDPGQQKLDSGPQSQTRAIRRGWSLGTVQFTYEDVDGDISFRTVTVHHVTRFYLKGECRTRRAERTFRLDRIIGTLTDCDTGEVLTPEECSTRFGL